MATKAKPKAVAFSYNRCLQQGDKYTVTLKMESGDRVFGYFSFSVNRERDANGDYAEDKSRFKKWVQSLIDSHIAEQNGQRGGLDVTAEFE